MADLPPSDGDGLLWYYLDSTNQEFGPFSASTMRDWFQQGFFPIGADLLVRLPDWKNFVKLSSVYPDINQAFVGPPQPVDQNQMSPMHSPPLDSYGGSYMGAQRPGAIDDMPPYLPQQWTGGYWMPAPPMAGGYGFPPRPGGPGMPAGFPPMPGGGGGPRGAGSTSSGTFPRGMRFQGRIKSFNAKQGFGFIECNDIHMRSGRDVFLHKAQIGDFKIGTEVTFAVEENKQGMPQAREVATLDGQVPGPMPSYSSKGPPGGGRGKGKGGGKKGKGDKGGGRGEKGGGGKAPQQWA